MEDWLFKIAAQAPGLVIALVIVRYFLNHLEAQAKRSEVIFKGLLDGNKEVVKRYEGLATKSTAAIAENSEVLRRISNTDP